jgi:hypothetical protein
MVPREAACAFNAATVPMPVGFEGVLGRIHHQCEKQRRHDDEEVDHQPDHVGCIVVQVLGA